MKLSKLIFSAAILSAGTALFAQSIHIGGYVDYTSTAAVQVFHDYPDEDDWDNTEVSAEFGPTQNGIHFLNLDATAPNVDFHTNVWIGSGLGPWYADVPEYIDRTNYSGGSYFNASGDDVSSPIGQMWLCTHFFDDQMRFYTGNFASNGWNAGYIFPGYVLGGQKIESLAMRGDASDSAFSGIEVLPTALTGFKAIVGFPIAPFTDSYEKFNDWEHFAKSIKQMAFVQHYVQRRLTSEHVLYQRCWLFRQLHQEPFRRGVLAGGHAELVLRFPNEHELRLAMARR